MSRFHAVMRVRVVKVADMTAEKLAQIPAVPVALLPLWTTVSDHDGAEHSMAGEECSLAIADLGTGDGAAALDAWRARRALFPFLAEVSERSVPAGVLEQTIVDLSRARLSGLSRKLGPAGSRQDPVVEITADDARALRHLVHAEMERVAAAVAEIAAAPASESPLPVPVEDRVLLIPDSPLERIARALHVTATEEAVIAEAHRLHHALAGREERAAQTGQTDERAQAVVSEIRAVLELEPDVDVLDHVRGMADTLDAIASELDVEVDRTSDRIAEIVTGRDR